MSKISVAMRLADELGVSFSKASKYVDEIGATAATKATDAARSGAKWSGDAGSLLKTGGLLAGGGTAAYLVANEQEVRTAANDAERAAADADSAASTASAVKTILESELPGEVKRQMIENLTDAANSDDENKDKGGLLPDDPQTLIILLIVLVLVFKFAMDGDD